MDGTCMYNCPTFFLFWKCLDDMSYWTNLYRTVADNELHFFTISNLNYTVCVSLAHITVRYAFRAASWSSFTCSFQPGTIHSLTVCLPVDTSAWLHFFKVFTIVIQFINFISMTVVKTIRIIACNALLFIMLILCCLSSWYYNRGPASCVVPLLVTVWQR